MANPLGRSKLPPPQECGLPKKFEKWRDGQADFIEKSLASTKRVKAGEMPTGWGKCFKAGTPVLMYDMSVVPIECVAVGDRVMGPDSCPRTVSTLARGFSKMYKVLPTKGDPYVVNSGHILSVALTSEYKNQPEKFLDLSVESYLFRSAWFRHLAKGYRAECIQYTPVAQLPLDPYFIGLWLGDGTKDAAEITTEDSVIVDYVQAYASSWGMRVSVDKNKPCPSYRIIGSCDGPQSNPIVTELRNLGIFGNKHIPLILRQASIPERLEILAGLLDSDGYLNAGCFDITLGVKKLAEGIAFLARSLGLAAYTESCLKSCQTGAEGIYYRTIISGDTNYIPTRLVRKQAKSRQQIKNVLRTGLTIQEDGYDEYYGFGVEETDQHFLLGDFTVVHNSPALVALALLSKQPTCYVTNSRGLQDQLMDDFAEIGMVSLKGRRNYDCDMKPDYTCEEGYAANCPYKGTPGCPSSQAEMAAAGSNLVTTNYAKWIASKKFGQGMSHFTQVIFDEAQDAPDALAQAMQVTLNHKEIEKELELDFPNSSQVDDMENWRNWAGAARAICEQEFIKARARITGVGDPKPAWVKHFTHMQNLLRRLATLATANPKNWVCEEIPDVGYQFDPIQAAVYSESALLLKVPSIICASATLRPKTLYMIGLSKAVFDYTEYDSTFDPKRCPIYYVETMRVDARAESLDQLWIRLDQVWSPRRKDRKGIIQTTSYQYQKLVKANSRFASQMLLNMKGEPPTEMIEQFLGAPDGTLLVSPSVGVGYNFKHDACRFQAFLKIPFDPPSKVLKAREERDSEYRGYRAVNKLVQGIGRDMREDTDWTERFIFDDHLKWFLPKYRHLFPKSFHGFFRPVTIAPPPLRFP